ncbi:hypothetical protein CPARA_1gp084 (nucleomorph) [Cryptomonas paramecium]|uniref:Uncharacterized protein n=1 Tax=Cryptomonas paramaecium TaxID=2898 RepID=F2HHE6_9CRYP|nr:hypothetical protein CPARA_1gp084 [Cryptomonas paramecium]AEA38742.1 hypothetical protein CPARA_1gp084 [Cryptomonas paramecium]
MHNDGNFGNVSILKFYKKKNAYKNGCLFSGRINFIPDRLYKKSTNNLMFGLIECYNTRISKKIVKTVNKLELIELNFLFELRFVRNVNKSNSIIIEHTNKIPINYFPKFMTKKNNCLEKLTKKKNTFSQPNLISLHSNDVLEFYNKQHNSIRCYIPVGKKDTKKPYMLSNFRLNSISYILKFKKNPDNNYY